MAPPTAHTDTTLMRFMHASLLSTADVLGWGVANGSYIDALNDALRAEGLSSAGAATNVARLEAQARRAAWQAVVAATAGDADYTAANGTIKRSQIHEQARWMLAQAERHLATTFGIGLGGGLSVATTNTAVW